MGITYAWASLNSSALVHGQPFWSLASHSHSSNSNSCTFLALMSAVLSWKRSQVLVLSAPCPACGYGPLPQHHANARAHVRGSIRTRFVSVATWRKDLHAASQHIVHTFPYGCKPVPHGNHLKQPHRLCATQPETLCKPTSPDPEPTVQSRMHPASVVLCIESVVSLLYVA